MKFFNFNINQKQFIMKRSEILNQIKNDKVVIDVEEIVKSDKIALTNAKGAAMEENDKAERAVKEYLRNPNSRMDEQFISLATEVEKTKQRITLIENLTEKYI